MSSVVKVEAVEAKGCNGCLFGELRIECPTDLKDLPDCNDGYIYQIVVSEEK